ncbi:MAG: bifunctional folylpolyglutamate synthase/dihydrofolate synthase, partial [Bacteroidetes bacterium]|nr:bifunctional folylpolyglutamate synthase/dihydrofolate synthase [Bacteroidota bacterium]
MSYRQTLDYLFSRLPMFHRIGAAAYKADLGNTIFLCKVLGNPEKLFPSVHIAGTNGKGSVSHMTASILQEAGYKTGLYTSPHLKDFRERIRINGKKIPKPKVTGFVKTNKSSFEPVQPSFFEYTFGMAIKYFADEETDVAVMETGMGGRLDSTNVVNSIVSVITNIGLDHTQFLGTTLEKIALEKAGIIKPGIPVVIGESQRETDDIFIRTAAENHSPVYFADSVYRVGENIWRQDTNFSIMLDVLRRNKVFLKNLECPLPGNYQRKNIITVCQTIEVLSSLGYQIKPDHIFAGIKNVVRNTGFSGR